MRSWRIVAVLLLSLALVGSMACNPFGNSEQEVKQQLVEVVRGDLVVSVTADGKLSLLQHRKLTFGTSGTIVEVNVKEGDKVTKGQVLASLDTTSMELAVRTVELAVKAAEIDLELATNSYKKLITPYPYLTFQFVIPESVDAIRVAQQQIKEAQQEFQKGLKGESYSMGEIKEQLRKAEESLAEAESKLAWGLGAGTIPNINYWTLRAAQMQMEKTQLALDSANNELNKAEGQLEKAIILAPIEGIIATVNVKEGDKLSSMDYATKTIIDLIDPSRMELNAEVDEIDIPDVKLGQRAIISVDALPDEQFGGKVTSVSPLPREEAGVVLYKIKIGFDVPEGSGLKIGMSAAADIIIDERSNVLLVPDRAIEQDSQGNPVVKVMVNEEIEEKPVVTGISDGFDTEIIDGLNEGEVVVVERRAK